MNYIKMFFDKNLHFLHELIKTFHIICQIYLGLKYEFTCKKWLHKLAYLDYKIKLQITNLNHK